MVDGSQGSGTDRADAPSARQVRERARELERDGRPYARVTVVRREAPVSAHVGDSAVVTADGEVVGWVGGAECAQSVAVREAKAAIESGESALIGLAPDPADVERPGLKAFPMTCHSGGTLELFVEPVVPGPELVVVGDSPVARAVARLGREVVSDVTVVVDGESENTADERRIPATGPETVADAIAGATAVVVASMGQYDELGVEAGLRSSAGYVGLVASDRRRDDVAAAVADRLGVEPDDVVAAVTTPAGLDISARSPEEIAVSVLAELVALQRGADDPIRIDARDASTGPWERDAGETATEGDGHEERDEHDEHGVSDDTTTATVVDPVCGMDVTVEDETPTVEHDGETYHFCGQGCADAFAAELGRYVGEVEGEEEEENVREEVTDV
jgi:xanthine dehydrogenase accessory factor